MATVSLNLKPFPVPTEVLIDLPGTGKREDGMQLLPKLRLDQLSTSELEVMIAEWAEAVMEAHKTK